MSRKSISWKLDLSSGATRVVRSFLLLATFCVGFFCSGTWKCQGQVTARDLGTVLSVPAASQNDGPEDSRAVRAQFIEYERQLNAMLKTRRDEEKQFVGIVVNQIRLGRIPSKLVATSFEWVRNKRPETKYPFVYFERVLRLQAGRLGLASQIPPFDFSIYSQTTQPLPNVANGVSETPGSDQASTERSGGFGFQRGSGLTDQRFGSIGGTTESSSSDGAETERGSSIFRLGGVILNRLRR